MKKNTLPSPACARTRPGAASGGCAFDGAQIALMPVGDAAHLVHGPITCAGLSWGNRNTPNVHGGFFQTGLTTDMQELDIVFGGEAVLRDAVARIVRDLRPRAVFVYSTCVSAMIGDDLPAICRSLEDECGLPVIAIEAPGFAGSKNFGNRLAGKALLDQVIGRSEPPQFGPTDVVVLGDYNVAGEFGEIESLLQAAGIRILSRITGNACYAELEWAHRGRVAMVVCSQAMVALARALEERHGLPFFEGSFFGPGQIAQALRNFARALGMVEVARAVEDLIAEREAWLARELKPFLPRLRGRRAFVYTGGVKSWSMVLQLEELGLEVVGTSTRKSTPEDEQRLCDHFGSERPLMATGDAQALLQRLRDERVDVLLAGGRNMYTAIKGRVPFVDVNQERADAFAGYQGHVNLARRICATLESPAWTLAARPAPWESDAVSEVRTWAC